MSTNPATWSTFAAAQRAYLAGGYDGISYAFAADDPFVFIDLDHVRDVASGTIAPWAAAIVERFATYTEISPSGDGLHLYCEGAIAGDHHKRGDIEVYWAARFSTVTGAILPNTPAGPVFVNGPLDALYAEIAPDYTKNSGAPGPPTCGGYTKNSGTLGDEEVIRRAGACAYGPAFTALLAGDTAAYGGDASAADLALCGYLAFWCGNDAVQIDRIFRGSGLFRAKWDSKRGGETYGAKTIARAWATEVYSQAPPAAALGEELAAARADVEALRVELAQARATIAQKDALIDRVEAEAPGKVIESLTAEVALLKAQYRTLLRVLECPDLTFKDRAVTALCLEVTGIVRPPPIYGEVPAEPPRSRLWMGKLEQRVGVSKGTAAASLVKAQALGFLKREVEMVPATRVDERPRAEVFILPGSGKVDPEWRERQNRIREARERAAQDAKKRQEAADIAAEPDRRAAAERAAAGCSCYGDLVPTAYVCTNPLCLTHWTPVALLALPEHTRKDFDWHKGRPEGTRHPGMEADLSEKVGGRSNVYTKAKIQVPRGDESGFGMEGTDPF